MSIIEKMNKNEWLFRENNRLMRITLNELAEAEELMEIGKIAQAIKILENIIENCPDCIEAYNDLYIARCLLNKQELAFEYLQKDVAAFCAKLPEELFGTNQSLEWGFLENRPFMRLYCNLGLEYLARNQFQKSKIIFEHLLEWNPNDNQGVREKLVSCYLGQGDFPGVINLTERYSRDMFPSIAYGRALAFCFLGKMTDAKHALKQAVKILPRVGKELLKGKHKKPKSTMEGYITIGGEDQAYEYWQEFGHFWKKPECTPLLQELQKLSSK